MARSFKSKVYMFILILFFIILYMKVFGTKNMVVGYTIALIAIMNIKNDLSFKPILSFVKIFALLLILGISAFLNNPLTIWGCILTFIVAFGTTFTSYNLFGTRVYLPYLMCYFMMVSNAISIEYMPMRMLSLLFGAIFIVAFNLIVNRKKNHNLFATVDSLIEEVNEAIDLKLEGKEISEDNFKESKEFYKIILGNLQYKFFPTKTQESVLNVVKAFQYIGKGIANENFTEDELKYTKYVLNNIWEFTPDEILEGIEIKTKAMALILLNLQILSNEVKKDLTDNSIIGDKRTFKYLFKLVLKRDLGFKSPKFAFAFKMALILFIWQLLTLMFNLPFTKWLYFITLPLMMPYVDDLKSVAKARIKGTFFGVFVFSLILLIIHFFSVSTNTLAICIMLVCLFIVIVKIENKFILAAGSTIISVMSSLMYINPPEALALKILWVVVGASVVSLLNFKFMPYSVETETKNSLKTGFKLNKDVIRLIKDKCLGMESDKKTALLVMSNIVHGNVEVTEENKELYDLQIKIMDISNFILTYLDMYHPSDNLKEILIGIIDKDIYVNDNFDMRDEVIYYSLSFVKKFYNEEQAIMRDFK